MVELCDYTAVIRTNRADELLDRVVASLRRQSIPPSDIIFVDSSGDEQTHATLQTMGRVVRYAGEFNYAKAINLGIGAVRTPFALMISSHTVPMADDLIERGWHEAQRVSARIIYWSPPPPDTSVAQRFDIIDAKSYTGRNGLSNSFGMIETGEALRYPFREDVFASEDQEWAKRYLGRHPAAKIVGVITTDIAYENRGAAAKGVLLEKYIQQELAHLLFTARRSKIPAMLLSRMARSALALSRGRMERARGHAAIVSRYLRHRAGLTKS
ncbi:glycosyltransferase family 2 protein [Sphingomonas sp.]|uniref:glycosyltransferase family 2 protein n=1 Tax=Sphingomonas sp. TaxID=28214 RepID=UPI0028A28614|nr:glycosyltransferase family 2 protein [Sphingomonas sp.]